MLWSVANFLLYHYILLLVTAQYTCALLNQNGGIAATARRGLESLFRTSSCTVQLPVADCICSMWLEQSGVIAQVTIGARRQRHDACPLLNDECS